MADIDVVKKRSNVWIWVIAAIVLVVLFWALMGGRSTARANTVGRATPAPLLQTAVDSDRSVDLIYQG